MAKQFQIRSSGSNNDAYIYIEDSTGQSMALGSDGGTNVFTLNMSTSANVSPVEGTAVLAIQPTTGDMVLQAEPGTGTFTATFADSTFTTGDVNISAGNLNMPTTANDATQGVITFGGDRMISFPSAQNVYIGYQVGTYPNVVNIANNVAIGETCMSQTTATTQCLDNIAIGRSAVNGVMDDTVGNIGIGNAALGQLRNGAGNVAIGVGALASITTPAVSNNTAVGAGSLGSLVTGTTNLALGLNAGSSYTTSESSNIVIGNSGTAAESNTIRIGTTGSGAGQQNAFYLGAVNGSTNGHASVVPYLDATSEQLATVPGGAVTMNTGTQTLNISSDASATTVSIAGGGAAKTVSLGSTNGASSLALKYGTADFSLASATGTAMSALDTGEITFPLQPAFLAQLNSPVNNVTGNGTSYTLGNTALTIVYDQSGDMNTNGTFTAPVTGKYAVNAQALVIGCTIASTFNLSIVSSNRTYLFQLARTAGTQNFGLNGSALVDMDASDTFHVTIQVSGEVADTDDIYGDGTPTTSISGFLAC